MKIVIIDDESIICNGLQKIIKSSKKEWIVEEIYTDPEEALEFCDWDNVDLLLADIHMPNIDGLTLVDTLRERGHNIQVIFISGFAEFEYAKKAIQQKAVDYIIKPVSVQNLLNAVLRAEDIYNKRKSQLRDEIFIKNSISWITKSFIYDMVFETRRINKDDIEQNLKFCKLENKQFSLSNFVMQTDNVLLEQFIDKYNNDSGSDIYLYRGSQKIYTIVLCEDKNAYSKIYPIMHEMKNKFAEIISGEVRTTENICDLACFYYDLMIQLKNIYKQSGQIENYLEHENSDTEENIKDMYSIHVVKAIQYIRENYSKKISLAKLSEELYVHPNYLSNLFKKQTGFNVVDYINNYRIEIAKKLLEDSRNKIFWVTEQVGFASQRYFNQKFKKSTGYTPVEYKQNYFFSRKNTENCQSGQQTKWK